jgi:superfamily II RNA helicase
VPRDHARNRGGLRHLTERLAALSVAELVEHERAHGPEATVAAIECHRCPWGATTACERAWRDIEGLGERLELRGRALEAFRGAYWQEFLRVMEVLEQFDAVRDGGLRPKGRLVGSLRHDNELLVAEVVSRGVFADTTLPEAAAVCSALIEEARSGEPQIARDFLRKRPKLRRKLEEMSRIADAVAQAQRARRLGIPVAIHPGFMPAVFRWASGDDDWSGIVEASFGGHEGDLVRAMRRLIDLLRQLGESAEVESETSRLLLGAARVVDRGVVLESALI